MKKSLHYLSFIFLFFTSCATQYSAVLTPDLPTQYVDAQGFATQKSDSLAVTFGYLYSTKDYLVFEVEVRNNTLDALTIDPQQFSYRAYDTTDSMNYSSPIKAHSFDRVLTTFDDRARKARRTATVITLISVAAVIAIDVAAHNHYAKTKSSVVPVYNDYNTSARFVTDVSLNYFDALIYNTLSKKEARKGLERSFLYPKTIEKSGRHIGTVYFPRNDNSPKLMFNFKVGEQDFETTFKQQVRMR